MNIVTALQAALGLKRIEVPESNETKLVDAVQLWEVRWTSRYGEYHFEVRPELECFTTKEAADEFAESLRNAQRLLRYRARGGTEVSVRKAGGAEVTDITAARRQG